MSSLFSNPFGEQEREQQQTTLESAANERFAYESVIGQAHRKRRGPRAAVGAQPALAAEPAPAVESSAVTALSYGMPNSLRENLPLFCSLRLLPPSSKLYFASDKPQRTTVPLYFTENPLAALHQFYHENESAQTVYVYEMVVERPILVYNFDDLHFSQTYDFSLLLPFIDIDSDVRGNTGVSNDALRALCEQRTDLAVRALDRAQRDEELRQQQAGGGERKYSGAFRAFCTYVDMRTLTPDALAVFLAEEHNSAVAVLTAKAIKAPRTFALVNFDGAMRCVGVRSVFKNIVDDDVFAPLCNVAVTFLETACKTCSFLGNYADGVDDSRVPDLHDMLVQLTPSTHWNARGEPTHQRRHLRTLSTFDSGIDVGKHMLTIYRRTMRQRHPEEAETYSRMLSAMLQTSKWKAE